MENKDEKAKNFEDFTNLYELSKTLRFELKPVGKTQEMLEENKVFDKDEIIQEKYRKTKKYFDCLHREFVKESLENAKLSGLEKYNKALKNVKKITRETASKDKKNLEIILEKEEKRLREEIVALFNIKAKDWSEKYIGLKNKDIKILDEEAVFSAILKEKYGKEKESFVLDKNGEKISIFDEWKGFTGYFTKFFETRRNFYKDEISKGGKSGKAGQISTRIVDQNLRRFVENIETINFIKKNYPDFSFSEVVKEYGFGTEIVCNLNFYASNCIFQDGIDKYNKDFVGKIKSVINFYRQKNKVKVPYLKILDKQILSEKEKFIDEVEDDICLKTVLTNFLETGENKTKILKNLFAQFVSNQEKFDLTKIYFSKKGFEQISRKWTSETGLWEEKLAQVFKDQEKKVLKKKESGEYPFPDFISLAYLKKSLEKIFEEKKEKEETIMEINFWKEKYEKPKAVKIIIWNQFLEIFKLEFDQLFKKTFQTYKGERIAGYDIFADNLSKNLKNEKIEKNKELKIIVKEFADSLLSIYQFSKYFAVEKSKKWDDSIRTDDEFYNNLEYGFLDEYYKDSFEKIITPYNLLRNYLTKKPWESVQKWKLNFENSTLAGGWDKNKETDNFAVILRKEEKYFLGLMKKGCNYLFEDKNKEKFSGTGYQKMVYKLLPGANKMLPKVFFSKLNIDFFNPSSKILKIRNHSSHTKGGNPQEGFVKKDFNLKDCHILINFFKESLVKHKEWKDFDFTFSNTSSYKDISDFYREVEKGGYKIFWDNISESYIEEKNKNGEFYLFQIKNKDWNKGSTGTKNLHTLYFENLFSQTNFDKSFVFKLNGQAEIFYRPKVTAEQLGYKKDKQGEKVINHKRYNKDKTFFHMPIALNRGVEKPFPAKFNKNLNEFLANNSDINIIGVDRGEKHLAYYSVINQKQEILDSGTLNIVENFDNNGNKIYSNEKKIVEVRNNKNEIVDYELKQTGKKVSYIDYKLLLEYKEKKRLVERQTWQAVESIKDLKKGYISQVIKKLADLAIEHNAIIVFEDLNMRFKQIRGGIEKSVYQQLEKALIEKLNFLVNKGEVDSKKAGHLLKAYQLTAPIEAFKDMGKQTGVLFYTTASYTSKIDPVTGWRPNLYLKKGNADLNKKTILKFSKIEFVNDRFEFSYDIKKFQEQKEYPKNTKWTVCSCVERFRWNRELNNNKGGYDHYENLTDEFKKLFESVDIDISENIYDQTKSLKVKGNEKFFSDFIFLFSLICQIRNTNKDEEGDNNDFIFSPVEPFFDSRKDNNKKLPKNGDDNGSYNIARKGIITLNKISKWQKENQKLEKANKKEKYSPNLYISNQEWDNFVQK